VAEPERSRVIYVTQDTTVREQRWLVIDVPFGLISPPSIMLHEPMRGPVVFYHASAYRLERLVPEEAKEHARG
jgi:hypothetical protein